MRWCSVTGAALVLAALAAGTAAAAADETEALRTYARGDYEAVVKALERSYRAGEASIQERLILARAYLHLGRSPQALGVLRSVIETDAENPEANALTGRLLHEAGKHEEALDYLKKAHRLKQEAATASTLGKCYWALGRTTEAKTYLEKALAEDIRDPSNSFLLGRICLDRGFGALAEKHFLSAEEAGMDSAELRRLLGRAYLIQHKEVGPIVARRMLERPEPGDLVDGYVVLGPLQGEADRYRVCTRFSALYEGYQLLARQPANRDARHMLAAGWLAAGDADQARPHLEALAAGEPDSRRTLELLVRLHLATKDVEALDRVLAEARRKKRFDAREVADGYYRAAMVLRADGRRDEAIAYLAKAEKAWPTSAKVLRSLAELSLATGRPNDARGYYARLVELSPDTPDIDRLRNALNVLDEKTGAKP